MFRKVLEMKSIDMKSINIKTMNLITLLGIVLSIAFIIYGIHLKIFTSADALKAFLGRFGIFAVLIFILVQIIQVVIPIIPGGISCLAGVMIFGASKGFLYNYIGICIGSIFAFLLARKYGNRLVEKLSKPKQMKKYSKWINSDKFDRWFATAIFFPVAPDDFLCYLAGTTKMSLKRFAFIIFAAKPFAIIVYSMGLHIIVNNVIQTIMT